MGFGDDQENIIDITWENLRRRCRWNYTSGFSDEAVPLIEKASQNIPVMTFNCDLPVESKKWLIWSR